MLGGIQKRNSGAIQSLAANLFVMLSISFLLRLTGLHLIVLVFWTVGQLPYFVTFAWISHILIAYGISKALEQLERKTYVILPKKIATAVFVGSYAFIEGWLFMIYYSKTEPTFLETGSWYLFSCAVAAAIFAVSRLFSFLAARLKNT